MTKKDELLTTPRGLEITEYHWELLRRGDRILKWWDEVRVTLMLDDDDTIILKLHGGDVTVRIPKGIDLAIAEIVLRLEEEKHGPKDSG